MHLCMDITFLGQGKYVHHLSDVPKRPNLTCCPLDACLIAQIFLPHHPYIYLFFIITIAYFGCKNYLEYIKIYYIGKVFLFSIYTIIWFGTNNSCIALFYTRACMQASFLFLLSKNVCKPRQPKNLLTSNNPSSHRRLPSSLVFGNSLLLGLPIKSRLPDSCTTSVPNYKSL